MSEQPAPSAGARTAHFQMKCVVPRLGTYLDQNHDFQFRFNKPRTALVSFTRDKDYPNAAVCAATCAADIPAAVATKLAAPFKEGTAALGSLGSAELDLMDEVFMGLRSLLKSTIDVFRWRHGLVEGPIDAVRDVKAFYSGDGKGWLEASLVRRVQLKLGIPHKKSLIDVPPEEIVRLVEAGKQEPVAHQLFREAWELRNSNPRSALAIGIAAVEIGVKDLIADLVPDAGWLVKEMPSPPIWRILREYLLKLPVLGQLEGKTIKPPDEIIKLINEGTKHRNNLVHAGAELPSPEVLERILRAVNDVLCICEIYMGEVWAASHLSGETITAWTAKD